MEEEREKGSLIINTMNSSSSSPIMMSSSKTLDFGRVLKVGVSLCGIVVACLVLYLATINNFGEFLPTNLGFSSFYNFNGTSSSSSAADELVVRDEYYELRKVLKEASTEDNTVILTTLNDAWAEPNSIFDLFLESFRIGNNTAKLLNHLLVIAVDDKAYNRCRTTVSHCYYLKTNQSSQMAHEAVFMTPIYMEMMWGRLAFLQTILSLGYSFVFTDTDVMWLRDPFPSFLPDVDYQTSCDQFNGNIYDPSNSPNNGYNYVRSNNRTIEFYKFWVASRKDYPGLHEQDVLNRIKTGPYVRNLGLSMRFLDTNYFGGFCQPSRDFNKVCTMHANCCVGLDRKIADLNTLLEDWKRYFSPSPNQNVSEPHHWRVPHQCRM